MQKEYVVKSYNQTVIKKTDEKTDAKRQMGKR